MAGKQILNRQGILRGIFLTFLAVLIAAPCMAAELQPQHGGTLKMIRDQGPKVLGYYPDMGPVDMAALLPGIEFIMTYNPDRTMVPQLAEKVVEDPDKLTFTIYLRKGVRFTDGSDLTAEVAAWNYQVMKDLNKLQANVAAIEVIDKYTLVLRLNEWNNGLQLNLGWMPIFSKAAYDKNGKDWARLNLVGTGPFKIESFKRDASISWVKNDDYWQKDSGLPYLDRIEVLIIPDPVTASSMMLAGQADAWPTAPTQNQFELQQKGFICQTGWAGMIWNIIPNTQDPNSKWQDKRLREALEYALDKNAIAKALGFGLYIPMTTVAPPGEWGYDERKSGRSYNPDKSRQLLAEAGYPDGLKVTLLAPMGSGGRNDTAESIKNYLDNGGFDTSIDIADPGRFFGSVFGKGWNDLALMFTGTGLNNLTGSTAWYSHRPKANLAGFARPQPLKDMFEKAWQERTIEGQIASMKGIVNYLTDEAMIVPVFLSPAAIVVAPHVHTTYPQEGLSRFDFEHTWIGSKK